MAGSFPIELGKNNSLTSVRLALVFYVAAIAAAEAVVAFVGPIRGALMHALLLLALLNSYALTDAMPYRHVFLVLTLAPLLRSLSLTIPIAQIPQIYWYAMIGIPLLTATALIARAIHLPMSWLKLRSKDVRVQILFALTGLPLGAAGFIILRPTPLFPKNDLPQSIIGALILFLFVGLPEEFIFRGMLQHIVVKIFGPIGMIFSNALFTSMYFGSLSLTFVVFMCLVGFLFALWVALTDTLWGVVGAHALLSIVMLLILPLLLQ